MRSLNRVRSISTVLFLCTSAAFARSLAVPTETPAVVEGESPKPIEVASETESAAFRAAMKSRADAAQKKYEAAALGRDKWLFFAPELRHIGAGQWWGANAARASQSVSPENADPLPAILDFKAQLDRAGIELLLVPVAPKAVVYADKIWKPRTQTARLDALHREFYAKLRENGVAVLDLTDDFLAQRTSGDALYCQTDTHWSGRATVVAARRIAEETKGREWLPTTKQKHISQWKRVPIEGDLWLGRPKTSRGPKETLALRFVGTANKGKTPTPVAEDRNSPVVLLGDSHALVFHEGGDMHTRGAGLADQLALELGLPIDVVAVRGSGATPARTSLLRRARADKSYLQKKKLVIWCFSAREWTESLGWQKVPVVPQ